MLLELTGKTIAEQNGIESPYIIHPDQELTISMDTIKAEMDGDKAQAAIEQAMSALDAEGAEMSVTAEGVKVDLANVEVDSDVAAAQIESALGMESGTLAANGIEIQAGATVTIPQELYRLIHLAYRVLLRRRQKQSPWKQIRLQMLISLKQLQMRLVPRNRHSRKWNLHFQNLCRQMAIPM